MENTENSNNDTDADGLAKTRLPEKISPAEKEVYEGKIAELKEENEKLRAENAELKKSPPREKKKSLAERFSPLG